MPGKRTLLVALVYLCFASSIVSLITGLWTFITLDSLDLVGSPSVYPIAIAGVLMLIMCGLLLAAIMILAPGLRAAMKDPTEGPPGPLEEAALAIAGVVESLED